MELNEKIEALLEHARAELERLTALVAHLTAFAHPVPPDVAAAQKLAAQQAQASGATTAARVAAQQAQASGGAISAVPRNGSGEAAWTVDKYGSAIAGVEITGDASLHVPPIADGTITAAQIADGGLPDYPAAPAGEGSAANVGEGSAANVGTTAVAPGDSSAPQPDAPQAG